MDRDPFLTEGGTTFPVQRRDLEARKRAVYGAFLAMGAAGALFSFALNLVRSTPDPAVARIQLATALVLGVAVLIVGWRRVPLPPLERVALAFGSLTIVGSIAWSLYGANSAALGRAAVQATLHWVPLVFAFGFVAFSGRTATRVAAAVLAAIALLVVPHDLVAARSGVSDDLFVLAQALVAYAVLIAGLRFFADLHVRASTLERTAERMRALAHTDALTGLGNRRQADLWLVRELQRADRYKRPFSVLMLDIDHFKRLNDDHGHAAGDRVLVDLAGELVAMVRASDAVVRWGGEEFLVLAPETGLEDAVQVAELVRRQIAKLPLGDAHRTTVSIGVAAHRSGDDPDGLVARADAALYMAKRSGRNVVRQEIAPRD
ncbi:MAG: GGDEF domain-containing protein [Trueperaceae bacterium]